MTSVLHITGWYPNALIPHEAPFIRRHVDALRPHATNTVWHIDVRTGQRWSLLRKSAHADRTFVVIAAWHRWLVIEWIATLLILWAWFTRDRGIRIDAIDFHMAYPNCTRIRLLRWVMRRPLVITEHYSAYRIGFNTQSRGVLRIKRIFHAGVPLIVVSRSLQADITRFAGPPEPEVHVVDNAVDARVFHRDARILHEEGRFFAIAGWRSPKRPDLMLEALARLREAGRPARLRMAGTGPDSAGIEQRIAELGLSAHVDLLGILEEEAVADEMRRAHALVHASDYETYSAVCAEALCCGTPVIASGVGGIVEFVTEEMGVLVASNTVDDWTRCWQDAWPRTLRMDRERIAQLMARRAGSVAVGEAYHRVIQEVIRTTASSKRA